MAEEQKNEAEKKEEHGEKKEISRAMERNLVLVFAAIGAVIGYISFLINIPLGGLVLAIIVYVVAQVGLKAALKLKSGKLLSGNALIVYFIVWLIVWTIFYNLQLIASY